MEWTVPEGLRKEDIRWVRSMLESCGIKMRKQGAWYNMTYIWST